METNFAVVGRLVCWKVVAAVFVAVDNKSLKAA